MSAFDGEAFGQEVAAIVRTALDRQKSEFETQIAALGERLARLEGAKSMPKRQTKKG